MNDQDVIAWLKAKVAESGIKGAGLIACTSASQFVASIGLVVTSGDTADAALESLRCDIGNRGENNRREAARLLAEADELEGKS